jgi:hypothetical protein
MAILLFFVCYFLRACWISRMPMRFHQERENPMRPSGCIAVGVSVHWCLDPARHTWEEYFLLWLFARMNEGGFLCQHALTKESKFNLESCSSREAKAVDNVNEYNIVVRYGACQKITSCYVCHERYLINSLIIYYTRRRMFCCSFPSINRATALGGYDQFYLNVKMLTKLVWYPKIISFENAIRSD